MAVVLQRLAFRKRWGRWGMRIAWSTMKGNERNLREWSTKLLIWSMTQTGTCWHLWLLNGWQNQTYYSRICQASGRYGDGCGFKNTGSTLLDFTMFSRELLAFLKVQYELFANQDYFTKSCTPAILDSMWLNSKAIWPLMEWSNMESIRARRGSSTRCPNVIWKQVKLTDQIEPPQVARTRICGCMPTNDTA